MITAHTPESLIAFELRIKAHWEAGAIPAMTHFCGGNEQHLIDLYQEIHPDDWVYSSHRAHYHALLKGVPEATVEAEILAGRSMFLFSAPHRFLSTAVLAGQCAICAGIAWASQWQHAPLGTRPPHVWCFLGDGAEEEGHFYEAALWVESNNLPCTFVIEDNGWQMETAKTERRAGAAWQPLDHFKCVRRYHYTRTFPHAGSGAKPGTITWQPEAVTRIRAEQERFAA